MRARFPRVDGQVHRRRIDWPFVFRAVVRSSLAIWFFIPSYKVTVFLLQEGYLGGDMRIYYRAVRAWLSGGDPWSAGVSIIIPAHYGAPPASLFPVAPFALLSEDQAALASVAICALAAIYVVRRLRMLPEWLMFPPLVIGVVSGNPSLPLLALLLTSSRWAPALAVALKVYAIVPVVAERRWRALAIAVVAMTAMVAVTPGLWIEYIQRFSEISSRLATESLGGYSATRWWPLVPPTVLALLIVARHDLRAAGWLAVPALWPGSEWHWSTLALPVMTPWLAFALAPDIRGMPAVVTWIYAVITLASECWGRRGHMQVEWLARIHQPLAKDPSSPLSRRDPFEVPMPVRSNTVAPGPS